MYCVTLMLEIRVTCLSVKVMELIYYKRIIKVHVPLLLRDYFPFQQLLEKIMEISMYYFHSDT